MKSGLALSRLNRTAWTGGAQEAEYPSHDNVARPVNCIVPFLFKLLGLALIKSIHPSAHLHLQMRSTNSMFNFYILMHDKKPMKPALETNQSRRAVRRPVSTSGEAQA
jgi:hypothetical protein